MKDTETVDKSESIYPNKDTNPDKIDLISFLIPTIISVAAIIISLIDSEIVLSWLVKPQVNFIEFEKERNKELILTNFLIKNNGNKVAEDIDLAITMPASSTFGITDIRTFDSSDYLKDDIRTVYFTRKYLVPEDSILITIESDTGTLNRFKNLYRAEKDLSKRKKIPNLVYFKSRDGYARRK